MELYSRHLAALGDGRQAAAMERLNDIMGRTMSRRHYSDARLQQESPQGAAQQHTSRRPLPEQTARQGPRGHYGAPQHHYRSHSTDETTTTEGRSYSTPPPTTRPFYPRQQRSPLSNAPSYPPRSRQRPVEEKPYEQPPFPVVPPTRPIHDYTTYPPALPADVVDEDEWEEEGGMVYGDWERDGDEVLIYQRPSVEVIPEQPPYYAEPQAHITEQISPTRTTRDLRMPVTAPPSTLARTQGAQRISRITQPLDPRVVAQMSTAQEQHKIRQLVPQEQRLPAPPALQKGACPKCKGAGYLRLDVPFGHPNFGKPIACSCKEAERKERRRQQLREMSNLDAFRSHSFRTFNPRVPGVQEAYAASLEYAQNPDGWLLLVGTNGCGKTHLAAAVANQCLDSGSVVLFSVVPDLLDHLRAAFAPDAKEVYDQLFSKMRESEVLVLDDLGAQQSSPWANEKLFQLLNYRYNMGMPTVITANPRGLQGIDERIRSRIQDAALVCTVSLDRARDYRLNRPRKE
ncbi:MAG: ATP-binding protein [Ktedonobacteraceae bacterium]|nr:ATP-binding protein [Ktedonobacteraceae bacterium]